MESLMLNRNTLKILQEQMIDIKQNYLCWIKILETIEMFENK